MPAPKPKTFKRAKRILEESLNDIRAGQWCTNALLEYGEISSPYTKSGKQVLGEDETPSYLDPRHTPITFYESVKGCALGLVSMYGGLGTLADFTELGDGHIFLPRYAKETDSPEIKKALLALVKAIPKTSFNQLCAVVDMESTADEEARSKKDATLMSVGLLNQFIWGYNDKLSRVSAEKWFKRAVELV